MNKDLLVICPTRERPEECARMIKSFDNFPIKGWLPTFREVHRERHYEKVVFFIPRLPKGEMEFYHLFRVTYGGKFHAMPAEASLMYFPAIRGHSDSKIFKVK